MGLEPTRPLSPTRFPGELLSHSVNPPRLMIVILVALAFAVLSLIMIIFWWGMQYEEYERACILIGRKYYLIDVLREFELICIIAVLSASLICFKYITISVIGLYALVCFFSTIIAISIRTVKFEGDVYGADY